MKEETMLKSKLILCALCAMMLTTAANAATSDSTYWCMMRGVPCDLTDFKEEGTCPDCGMRLVTKDVYDSYWKKRNEEATKIGIVLYRGFEPLDVYGPLEMWANVSDFRVLTIAAEAGPVTSALGSKTVADYGFDDCPKLDVLMVPGGMGTLVAINDEAFLSFIREQHEAVSLTTSVCSGSWLLAKAGILDGRRATSNKLYFVEAQKASDKVDWVPSARWVEDGNVITSSGVSAGMDMALYVIQKLRGEDEAEKVAKLTEYVWNKNPHDDPFTVELRKSSTEPKHDASQQRLELALEIDPICGMTVKLEAPEAVAEHKGKHYGFCSVHCKEEFQKNPDKFLKQVAKK